MSLTKKKKQIKLEDLSGVRIIGPVTDGQIIKYKNGNWEVAPDSTIEVRTDDPINPAVGRMWLRSDL